jgi:hypothetical protein
LWLHSLKVAQLLRSAACLHTNQTWSYLNHLVSDFKSTGHWTLCRLSFITFLSLSNLQLFQVFLLYLRYQQQTIQSITNIHTQLCVLFSWAPPMNSNMFVVRNTNHTANCQYPDFYLAFQSACRHDYSLLSLKKRD